MCRGPSIRSLPSACGRATWLARRAAVLVAFAAIAAACSGDAPGEQGDGLSPPTTVETSPSGGAGGPGVAQPGSCRGVDARVGVLRADSTAALVEAAAPGFTQATGIAVDLVDRDAASRRSGGRADAVALSPLALDDWQRSGLLLAAGVEAAVEGSAVPAGLVDAAAGWLAPSMSLVVFTAGGPVERVPASFAELAADRTLTVGLADDPRRSVSALAAVVAASVANGGSVDDAIPGIDWFADLSAAGRLVGSSPDVLIGLGDGRRPESVVPADAVVGWPVLVGLLAGARRPCADAWMRYLVSSEAALAAAAAALLPSIWATPAALGAVPAADRRLLPAPSALAGLQVLDADAAAVAAEAVRDAWADRVGDLR